MTNNIQELMGVFKSAIYSRKLSNCLATLTAGIIFLNGASAEAAVTAPSGIRIGGIANATEGQTNGGVNWVFDSTKTNGMQIFWHLPGGITNASVISGQNQTSYYIGPLPPGPCHFTFQEVVLPVKANSARSTMSAEFIASIPNSLNPITGIYSKGTRPATPGLNDGGVNLGFQSSGINRVRIAYNKAGGDSYIYQAPVWGPTGTNQSEYYIGGLSSGEWVFRIIKYDNLYNASAPSADFQVSIPSTVITAPTFTPVYIQPASNNISASGGVLFDYYTDPANAVIVRWYSDANSTVRAVTNSVYQNPQEVGIWNTLYAGNNYFTFQGVNAAGVTTTPVSPLQTVFVTDAVPTPIVSVLGILDSTAGTSTGGVLFNYTIPPNDALILTCTSAGGTQVAAYTSATNQTQIGDWNRPAGTYNYTFQTIDPAGNKSFPFSLNSINIGTAGAGIQPPQNIALNSISPANNNTENGAIAVSFNHDTSLSGNNCTIVKAALAGSSTVKYYQSSANADSVLVGSLQPGTWDISGMTTNETTHAASPYSAIVSGTVGYVGNGGATAITLFWDRSIDEWTATTPNYRIHYGTSSQNYTSIVSAGNTNRLDLTNLEGGRTYYGAATLQDLDSGEESDFSNQIYWTQTWATNNLNFGAATIVSSGFTPTVQGNTMAVAAKMATLNATAVATVATKLFTLQVGVQVDGIPMGEERIASLTLYRTPSLSGQLGQPGSPNSAWKAVMTKMIDASVKATADASGKAVINLQSAEAVTNKEAYFIVVPTMSR